MNIRSLERLENAFSLGLLAVLIGFPIVTIFIADTFGKSFGVIVRMVVGLVILAGYVFVVLPKMHKLGQWFHQKHIEDARENYTGIYRVLARPTDDQGAIWCGESITLGDYGWQHKYMFPKKGLIYLQGLTSEWGCAWRAGFRPDQIEYVGPKPACQYDWYDFEYAGKKPVASFMWPEVKPKDQCPYPIQAQIKGRLSYPDVNF